MSVCARVHVCVEIANSHRRKKSHLHFNDKVQFISGHETLLQETLRFFPHNTGFHGCLISADHYSMLMLLIILCDDFQTGSSQRRVELDVDGMDGEDLFPFCFPQGLWVGNMKTMTFLKSPTGRSGLFGGLDSVRRPPVDNNWARHFLFLSIKILFCHTCFFFCLATFKLLTMKLRNTDRKETLKNVLERLQFSSTV